MRVTKIRKIEPELSADITTSTENFYAKAGDKWVLLHNSPAVFAGIDPSDGKFFVAKKSVFSSKGEVYKKPEDVDNARIKGDLNTKLKLALQHLPSLGIKSGVIQGDFLFDKDSLETKTIDGVEHITFHPNTIVYAVPKDSEMAKKILSSEIGIVWHTKYTGSSLPDMTASYGEHLTKGLKDSKTVWSQDATYHDVSGTATMTQKETQAVTRILSHAGKLFNKLDRKTIDGIKNNSELLMRTKTFINSKIRQGQKIGNTTKFAEDLLDYTIEYYMKSVEKYKTEKRKATERNTAKKALRYFQNVNKQQLVMMFDIYNDIVMAKQIIIKKLNKAKSIGTFIMTKDGLETVGHEGFVAVSHDGKSAVKLVDRLEFSHANFNPEILKGWDKPGR